MLKRVKKRYLVVEVDSAHAIGEGELLDAIWTSITKLYGEYGASKVALRIIDYETARKVAFVRIASEALEMTRTAIAAVTKINNGIASLHVAAVSGTIKSLRQRRLLD